MKPDDVIAIKHSSPATDTVRAATELTSGVPAWLQADHDALTAKVLRLPERSEISAPVEEQHRRAVLEVTPLRTDTKEMR